jgi:hypothetical protein
MKLPGLFQGVELVKPSIPEDGRPAREFLQRPHLVGHDDDGRIADPFGQDAAGAAVEFPVR